MKGSLQLATRAGALPGSLPSAFEKGQAAGKLPTFASAMAALIGNSVAATVAGAAGVGATLAGAAQNSGPPSGASKQPVAGQEPVPAAAEDGLADGPPLASGDKASLVNIVEMLPQAKNEALASGRVSASSALEVSSKSAHDKGEAAKPSKHASSKRISDKNAKGEYNSGGAVPGVLGPVVPSVTAISSVVIAPQAIPHAVKSTQPVAQKQGTATLVSSGARAVASQTVAAEPAVAALSESGLARPIPMESTGNVRTPDLQRAADQHLTAVANVAGQAEQASKTPAANDAMAQHPSSFGHTEAHAGKAISAEATPTGDISGAVSAVRTDGHAVLNAPGPAIVHTGTAAAAPTGQSAAASSHAPASATQLLDRMDMASRDGTVQVRGDARHLEVGVASGPLGWVEVHATTSAAGKVDAALHLEGNAHAQAFSNQTGAIVEYARQHQVQLGQISVAIGTGDGSSRGQSGQSGGSQHNANTRASSEVAARNSAHAEEQSAITSTSLISIRA